MATRSLREALHNPLGNVLVFTREDEIPIRLQLRLFEKAPGLKRFFLNPNYQRRMQRRHGFLQNGRPAGIEYILDLVPPLEGDEAVDAVENMYCPPSVQRWKCQLEGWTDSERPWVEDDDGGEFWLRKSDQEFALDRFRANYEVDMKKKREAEELAAEEAVTLALHQEQHDNAREDIMDDGLYPPSEEYCQNRNEYVRAQLPPAQAPAARPASPTIPISPTIPASPIVPASPTIPAPPPLVVEDAEVKQEGGNWYDVYISDNVEDTLALPPMPAALSPDEEVRLKAMSEAENQFDTLHDILFSGIETLEATDSTAATWTQLAGQPRSALLATSYQFGEPSQSFGAPETPRPRHLSRSPSVSSVTKVPRAALPSDELDFRKDLETAKALSLECQQDNQLQSVAPTLSPVEETIPPAYSRARHSGAIERILAIMCGEDPHIYSAPMWYTIYRVARTLSCEALVVDHILLWLYAASPGFIELFTPLCVQIATDLRAPALYRECFALCVAREISSSPPLHPVNFADFPELTRLAVSIASASFKKRLDQTWKYLTSFKWLDELAHFPKLNPHDAETIKTYLRYRFSALMEGGIKSDHDTPFAPPAPHPSIPLDIYNTWRWAVNNECTPQTRLYNAYVWLQIRDLRWDRSEMPDVGLDGVIKHELRAISDDVLYNELSEPSDFMMLLGLCDEQWACMPAWVRGEEEEEAKQIVQLEVREGPKRGESSEMEFECGTEPSDLARSVETESWGEVSEVGSVLTLFESTGDMDEEDMVQVVDEVMEEIEDLGLQEYDGWDSDDNLVMAG